MSNQDQKPGDQLRQLAAGLDRIEIPAAVRMLLPGGLDLQGARVVLEQAAQQLDRLDEIEGRVAALEKNRA
ncbi:hypothetical protein [uncultured Microbulbifer sp.]|uniref:hypothetical protein n=1 Tax=uncultured Microbulbifer sp. TaxID=348147 RepID=UPI0026399E70|nr:hypothetical protein [uncultured Microbulbifer sp.]